MHFVTHILHFLSDVRLRQDFGFRRLDKFSLLLPLSGYTTAEIQMEISFYHKKMFCHYHFIYRIKLTQSDGRTHVRRKSVRKRLTVFARYKKELYLSFFKQYFTHKHNIYIYIYIYIWSAFQFEFVVTHRKLLYSSSNLVSKRSKFVPFFIIVIISIQRLTSNIYEHPVRTAQ